MIAIIGRFRPRSVPVRRHLIDRSPRIPSSTRQLLHSGPSLRARSQTRAKIRTRSPTSHLIFTVTMRLHPNLVHPAIRAPYLTSPAIRMNLWSACHLACPWTLRRRNRSFARSPAKVAPASSVPGKTARDYSRRRAIPLKVILMMKLSWARVSTAPSPACRLQTGQPVAALDSSLASREDRTKLVRLVSWRVKSAMRRSRRLLKHETTVVLSFHFFSYSGVYTRLAKDTLTEFTWKYAFFINRLQIRMNVANTRSLT